MSCSFSGVTAMLWVPPVDSVTSAPASVSASPASPVSTASAVRSTTSGLAPKAANVRTVGTIELEAFPTSSQDRLAPRLAVRAVPKPSRIP